MIAVVGDGGFLYNAQEMATAVQQRINVVAVVFNDNAYGNVARDLDELWAGAFGADLRNRDFMRLAEAFGVQRLRAAEPTQVGRLVRDAVQRTAPCSLRSRWAGCRARCSSRRGGIRPSTSAEGSRPAAAGPRSSAVAGRACRAVGRPAGVPR